MSAKHAVLGLVIERPGYGYQLAQQLRERCGSWGWEPTGVYGALNLLVRDGHIRRLGEKGPGDTGRAAPRVIYEATPRGVAFFNAWLLESSAPSPTRQELDLKILLAGTELIPQLIDLTWAQEQQCLDDLSTLAGATPASPPDGALTWREAASILHRDAEIRILQVRIEWLQNARRVMRQLYDRPSSRSAGAQSGRCA